MISISTTLYSPDKEKESNGCGGEENATTLCAMSASPSSSSIESQPQPSQTCKLKELSISAKSPPGNAGMTLLPRRAPPSVNVRASNKKSQKEEYQERTRGLVAKRIRYILNQLDRGELSPDDLKKNLEYAALVLETAYADDSRRLLEEDDDQADFGPEAIPDEVREWLASTFTRQTANNRPKPKFKAVANAIKTGIAFDKIFRRLSGAPQVHIPAHIAPALKNIDNWEFDVFKLNEISDNNALKYVGMEIFQRYNLLAKYKIPLPVLENFLGQLQMGYSKHQNPYHNLLHAADVTQTVHWMISQTGLIECLSELELFACLFAALIHDYEHTGHTNNFHIQSNSDYALLYNDRSVLENHHISSVFRFMRETSSSECSVLSNLSKEEYREFRSMVVEIVLATDMSTHFTQVKTVKNMLTLPEGIDKLKSLCLVVHCCDISHPAKTWPLHHRWTMLVLEEFFRQGDLEASMGLPYSPLCDRHTTQIPQSQIGFIDFIVEPTLIVCGDMLTKMVEPLVFIPPNNDDGSSGSNHLSPSPSSTNSEAGSSRNSTPDSSNSPRPFRRLPLGTSGKLDIPQPWLRILQENKARWKEQAAIDDAERKKLQPKS